MTCPRVMAASMDILSAPQAAANAAAFHHLKADNNSNGKVGVVEFCFGGGIVNKMAVRLPGLSAGVPFYGSQPKKDAEVAKIKLPLLINNGGIDKRVNRGWPAYEAALKAHGKEYKAYIYEGANHGFHNDTTPRYDEAAAKLAWEQAIKFFTAKLS